MKKLRKLNLAMMGFTAALLVIGLGALTFMEDPANQKAIPFFNSLFVLSKSLLLLAGFSIAAFLIDYPRLYLYGLLLFGALPAGEWLYTRQLAPHHGFPTVFGIVAGIMILTGLLQFAYMLKTNPEVPVEGE